MCVTCVSHVCHMCVTCRLLLGFMLSSAFLSMWISNTATAAMMLAIAHAVLQELKGRLSEVRLRDHGDEEEPQGASPEPQGASPEPQGAFSEPRGAFPEPRAVSLEQGQEGITRADVGLLSYKTSSFSGSVGNASDEADPLGGKSHLSPLGEAPMKEKRRCSTLTPDKTFDRLCKGLMLGVTYSANIGGIGTLTGTGPNLLLRENAVRLVHTLDNCWEVLRLRERGGNRRKEEEREGKEESSLSLQLRIIVHVAILGELGIKGYPPQVFGLDGEPSHELSLVLHPC